MEDERSFAEDESVDQGLAGLVSAHCFPHLNGERVERYSRKVFVGGLPPDIDEGEEKEAFQSHLMFSSELQGLFSLLYCCSPLEN